MIQTLTSASAPTDSQTTWLTNWGPTTGTWMEVSDRVKIDLSRRLSDIADPVQRNYAITAEYHKLGMALADRLGKCDANWLTFGAWASHSAGKFIRGDLVPVRWGRDAVAQGNLAIICDIGPRFAKFLELSDALPPRDVARAVQRDPLLTQSPSLAELSDGRPRTLVQSVGQILTHTRYSNVTT